MYTKSLIAAAVAVALAGGGYAVLKYTGVLGSHACCHSGDPAPGASPEPAALPADDAALIASQIYCPIMPETKLGEMGQPVKIMVKDKAGVEQPAFVCCKGCKRRVLANPEATLAKVAEFKAVAADRAGR